MLIQSILFFILGVATISWLLVLVSPLIWRKVLHFAYQSVSAKIPLSLIEIQANYNFLCAQHAVELARHEQQYDSLQKKYAQQKIQLSQKKEQLYCSYSPAQYTPFPPTKIEKVENKDNVLAIDILIREIKAMQEKIAHYEQRLKNIQIDELDTAAKDQLLNELCEETKELAATLAAHIALKEGKDSSLNKLIKSFKKNNDLASYIHKKIANTKIE
ncbi:conserved protein of unknown function [Bartonella clarridgeiae 73]|uniref:Uncharacterized protein n=1 Tax=Bartonella clarridgeiae (strain CCUG 45776 / CIP 104772 / 73) TaxID=696125 RepID=E6YGI5_BARC7|nr:hypothetical protein [Bartonella clarridgeiae]WCR55427.1 MAG: hypothetical protein PG977_000820 [Bartonella clarridgeiae]CBI75973.1 conserved protein of unknown function [Bartonella clarridgeiae 73]